MERSSPHFPICVSSRIQGRWITNSLQQNIWMTIFKSTLKKWEDPRHFIICGRHKTKSVQYKVRAQVGRRAAGMWGGSCLVWKSFRQDGPGPTDLGNPTSPCFLGLETQKRQRGIIVNSSGILITHQSPLGFVLVSYQSHLSLILVLSQSYLSLIIVLVSFFSLILVLSQINFGLLIVTSQPFLNPIVIFSQSTLSPLLVSSWSLLSLIFASSEI